MKTKLQLLLHPLFILSLICLLINDLYWKYEFHNWLTGKLSDFTGLFVLSVFLSAFFYKHRSIAYFTIIIFFIWWKTPLSQPLIDLLDESFSLTFQRTIDYTDYIAIPVVFAAHFLKPAEYNFSFGKKLAVYLICGICFFAFCSTSYYRKFMISPELGPKIDYNEYYPTRLTQDDVLFRLDSLQISYKVDSFTIAPLRFHGGSILVRNRDSIQKNMFVIDPEQRDTALYFRINERPYIAIYDLKVKGVIIPQVNISVRTNQKKNEIRLESIVLSDEQFDEYYQKRSKTKIKFRKLILEGLIGKLK
jgi:hypothetical protein